MYLLGKKDYLGGGGEENSTTAIKIRRSRKCCASLLYLFLFNNNLFSKRYFPVRCHCPKIYVNFCLVNFSLTRK
jgi:hypothetical protein